MNLPMVLVNALPRQERANAQHLEEQGCAVWIRKNELADTVDGLLKNEDKLKQMALACGNDKKHSAHSKSSRYSTICWKAIRTEIGISNLKKGDTYLTITRISKFVYLVNNGEKHAAVD